MSATGQPLVARCRTQAAGKTPAALCSRAAYWALAKVIYLLPCFTPFVTHFIQALMCAAAGVAPFRAMLEERQAQAQATSTSGTAGCTQGAPNNSASPAPCTLFFGCRSRAADFYYGQQWHELQDQGVLLPPPDGLVVAFSRDQPSKVCLIERVRTPCFPTASRRLSMQPCDQGSTMEMALVLWLAYMLVPCLIEPAWSGLAARSIFNFVMLVCGQQINVLWLPASARPAQLFQPRKNVHEIGNKAIKGKSEKGRAKVLLREHTGLQKQGTRHAFHLRAHLDHTYHIQMYAPARVMTQLSRHEHHSFPASHWAHSGACGTYTRNKLSLPLKKVRAEKAEDKAADMQAKFKQR
eukprot:1160135-Pelagomonas_calceolata.AAC.8